MAIVPAVNPPRRLRVSGSPAIQRRAHRRQCTLALHLGYELCDPRIHALERPGVRLFFRRQPALAAEPTAAACLAATSATQVADQIAGSIAASAQEAYRDPPTVGATIPPDPDNGFAAQDQAHLLPAAVAPRRTPRPSPISLIDATTIGHPATIWHSAEQSCRRHGSRPAATAVGKHAKAAIRARNRRTVRRRTRAAARQVCRPCRSATARTPSAADQGPR